MLRSVITDYLDRFSGVLTESVYNAKGIQDYNYMRRCYDYLECEKNILSQPRTSPAGLRNIGNTCYLNTILQLLFHINFMRQKLCTTDVLPTKLHQKLQFLFGSMAVGKMPFADPTEVFEQLRAGNSEVFAPGVQNDFHEVFTLLIDRISQGYKKNSPEEARFIKKLMFGKMTTKISYLQETINKAAQFNIINLDSAEGSFNKALQKWKRFAINDFCTPNGQKVTAQCENIFVQTPALMGFFINRVTYKNGKLQKNCRPFAYEDSILIAKAFQSDKTISTKSFTDEKEKQLNAQKKSLKQWMRKKRIKKTKHTGNYQILEVKISSSAIITYSNYISIQIENPLGEKARLLCLEYLQKQLGVISKRSQEIEAEISKIQQQMSKIEQQQNCQRYILWGMMIHEGNSAIFGHYKLCLQFCSDWYEFNDKLVTKISRQSLESYNQRGEICCLFYRRPTLICDNKKIPIPFQLKGNVSQYQNNLKADIDKSRILQILYQQTESVSILLEYEMQRWQNETYQFFFKPIHFALSQKYNLQICKGIVLQEQINSQHFIASLKEKLINDEDIKLPINSFKFLQPYFQIRKHLCTFFDREIKAFEVGTAYNELSKAQLKFSKNVRGNQILNQMIEVIALKGLYYFKFFSEMEFQNSTKILNDLSEGLDRLLEKCSTEEFMLVSISIKASIQADAENKKEKEQVQLIFQTSQITDYGQYFTKGFKFWIDQRKNLNQLDETNFLKDSPSFKSKLKST